MVRPADPRTLMERRESASGGPMVPRVTTRLDTGRRRGRREIRSCWGSPASLSSRQGVTPCEWAELPRELSTVSHSGQADAQGGQVLEARDRESSRRRDGFAAYAVGASLCGDVASFQVLWQRRELPIRATSRAAPKHEIHRQRGAARDRFRGFGSAHEAELGLRKSVCAHDARWTDGAEYLGSPLVR